MTRQSPDWETLAQDYETNTAIDIGRYKPAEEIPGFPDHIEQLIGTWNQLFGLNFFRCRQILKEIAAETIRRIPGARRVEAQALGTLLAELRPAQARLFYMDDDDWFAPDLHARLRDLDFSSCPIAVFPLLRIGAQSVTFVRPGKAARTIIGSRRDFDFRFQTNNYAIAAAQLSPQHIPHLMDHVRASDYADREHLQDSYFDCIISATNKTPCSASYLPILLRRRGAAQRLITGYSDALRALSVPESEAWLREPIAQTIALFDRVALPPRQVAGLSWFSSLRRRA